MKFVWFLQKLAVYVLSFGTSSACVALKAKFRFAASRETCFYLRRSGTLRRTEEKLPHASDKLLFILSYLKNSPLQEYNGACLV
jgi:hypothetical protein